MKGADDMRYMALQPPSMLSFDWSAPPSVPEIRRQRTFVVVRIEPTGERTSRVTLHHTGWGTGGEWDRTYAYFDRAWGNVLAGATNPTLQPFRFAGGLYDTDTGFVHFGARDYDPATGRWLSKDAARWTGGYNFYGYVNGDPVNYIDVNGRNPFAVALGIGVTVGETVAASVAVAVTWDVLFNKAKGTKAIVKAVEKAIDKCKPGPQPDFCSLEDGDGRCNADKTIWCQYRCASGGTKSEYQYQTDCAPGKVLNWRVRCEQTVVGP